MSTQTPTTKEVNENLVSQFEAAFGQSIPLMPKSAIRVIAKVAAGLFVILYKYAGFLSLQTFVRFASFKETEINGKRLVPLIEWGRLIGAGDPNYATRAELRVEVTVESQGGTLESGTQLIKSETGVVYLTKAAVSLNASTVTVDIVAVSDQSGGGGGGTIGNLQAGQTLGFANPLPNVARTVTVTQQLVTAADAESEENYRSRVIDYFQRRPQGGAYADYEEWAVEVEGIISAYPYTGDPGQVDVYTEATPASSGNADGIPTQAQLDAVKDNIELNDNGLASRRPANAFVNSLAITRTGFDVEVTGLSVDDEAQVKQDVEDALTEYFLQREPFIPGLSIPPRKDRITTSAIGGVVERVVTAAGGVFGVVNLEQGGTGTEAYQLGEGEKAKLSTVSFI